MATVIAHRELRNNSSEVLRRVAAGEHFEVTNHGEVVAVLLPAGAAERIAPAMRRASAPTGFAALPRLCANEPTGRLLDELRGER